MKVILLQDVKKVGKKGQTLEVSDGYAANFLIPKRLAVKVTEKSVQILEKQNNYKGAIEQYQKALKLDKSKLIKERQAANILVILVTLDVSNADKSIVLNTLQS